MDNFLDECELHMIPVRTSWVHMRTCASTATRFSTKHQLSSCSLPGANAIPYPARAGALCFPLCHDATASPGSSLPCAGRPCVMTEYEHLPASFGRDLARSLRGTTPDGICCR